MQAGLSQPGSTWYMLKLSSMTTIIREWTALHAVQDLKFKDVLLSAKTSTSRRTSKLLIPQVLPRHMVVTQSSCTLIHWATPVNSVHLTVHPIAGHEHQCCCSGINPTFVSEHMSMFKKLIQPATGWVVAMASVPMWSLCLGVQAMQEKIEGDYNASQVSAVTQGLDGSPVVLIQVHSSSWHLQPPHKVVSPSLCLV